MKYSQKMKNSGVEWIGEIPDHWNCSNFKYGIRLLTDFESNGSYEDLRQGVTLDKGKPYAWFVRITDLEKKRFGIVKGNRYCDKTSYNFLKKTKLNPSDLLVAKVGAIGKIWILPSLNEPATLGNNMYLIKLNSKLNSKFAYFRAGSGRRLVEFFFFKF